VNSSMTHRPAPELKADLATRRVERVASFLLADNFTKRLRPRELGANLVFFLRQWRNGGGLFFWPDQFQFYKLLPSDDECPAGWRSPLSRNSAKRPSAVTGQLKSRCVPQCPVVGSDPRAWRRSWTDYGLTEGYPGQELRFCEVGPAPRGLKIPPTPFLEFPRSIKWCHAGAVYLFDSSISCRTEKSRIKRSGLVRIYRPALQLHLHHMKTNRERCPKSYDLWAVALLARIITFRASYLIFELFMGRHSELNVLGPWSIPRQPNLIKFPLSPYLQLPIELP
jgi:hypothetical protein